MESLWKVDESLWKVDGKWMESGWKSDGRWMGTPVESGRKAYGRWMESLWKLRKAYSCALTTICVDEVLAPRSRPTTVRQGSGGAQMCNVDIRHEPGIVFNRPRGRSWRLAARYSVLYYL